MRMVLTNAQGESLSNSEYGTELTRVRKNKELFQSGVKDKRWVYCDIHNRPNKDAVIFAFGEASEVIGNATVAEKVSAIDSIQGTAKSDKIKTPYKRRVPVWILLTLCQRGDGTLKQTTYTMKEVSGGPKDIKAEIAQFDSSNEFKLYKGYRHEVKRVTRSTIKI